MTKRPRQSTPAKAMSSDHFEFPIKTNTGQSIETVGEAFAFIDALSDKTQKRPECQLAIRELHRAVTEDRNWLFFARMGINRAIHGTEPPVRTPRLGKDWTRKKFAGVFSRRGGRTKELPSALLIAIHAISLVRTEYKWSRTPRN
jgi:hypothetical protein